MDLLENVAQELQFEFHLYITPDGLYGATTHVWDAGHHGNLTDISIGKE